MKPSSLEHICPVTKALTILGGKWKLPLLKQLTTGTKRYNQLFHQVEGITQRMLTKQLRELEEHGVVKRTVYPEIPPKVEYSLTPAGEALEPVLAALATWGKKYTN